METMQFTTHKCPTCAEVVQTFANAEVSHRCPMKKSKVVSFETLPSVVLPEFHDGVAVVRGHEVFVDWNGYWHASEVGSNITNVYNTAGEMLAEMGE